MVFDELIDDRTPADTHAAAVDRTPADWTKKGSWFGSMVLVLRAVYNIRTKNTMTERTVKISMRPLAVPVSTCLAYSVEANARIVRGKEYAHQLTLNLRIELLNKAGLAILPEMQR